MEMLRILNSLPEIFGAIKWLMTLLSETEILILSYWYKSCLVWQDQKRLLPNDFSTLLALISLLLKMLMEEMDVPVL